MLMRTGLAAGPAFAPGPGRRGSGEGVNLARTFEVFRQEFTHSLRRPLFWVQVLLLGFMIYMMSTGKAQIELGRRARRRPQGVDHVGVRAHADADHADQHHLRVLRLGRRAGMSMIRDDEQKVGELLHSTPLQPAEYVWGKYLAVLASFTRRAGVPGRLRDALQPRCCRTARTRTTSGPSPRGTTCARCCVFALPTLVLFTGACFAIGGLSRLPVLVFAFPIAVLIVDAFFLWEWSPAWLPLGVNRVLQFVDPTGLRWLKETWLLVDRGVDFYNHARVGLDTPGHRAARARVRARPGLRRAASSGVSRPAARRARDASASARPRSRRNAVAADPEDRARRRSAPLATLGMRTSRARRDRHGRSR